jgi:hypothetical protein
MSICNERANRRVQDHAGPAEPDGGGYRGQRRQGAHRPRPGRRRRFRPSGAARAVHHRLSAGGPRAQAGVPIGLPGGDRDPGAGNRRWRTGHADRQPLGRGWQALQCLRAVGRRPHRRAALQGQPAELRRVRRKAPVRARARRWPCDHPRHPGRGSHLRGHLAGGIGRLRERRRVPGGDRRRNSGGPERLALCARQERRAVVDRGRPCHRERASACLSQPGRRPG